MSEGVWWILEVCRDSVLLGRWDVGQEARHPRGQPVAGKADMFAVWPHVTRDALRQRGIDERCFRRSSAVVLTDRKSVV